MTPQRIRMWMSRLADCLSFIDSALCSRDGPVPLVDRCRRCRSTRPFTLLLVAMRILSEADAALECRSSTQVYRPLHCLFTYRDCHIDHSAVATGKSSQAGKARSTWTHQRHWQGRPRPKQPSVRQIFPTLAETCLGGAHHFPELLQLQLASSNFLPKLDTSCVWQFRNCKFPFSYRHF